MAHVVLNEVMANPIGPEPHQEWVELYNDGQADAALSGYRILDIGGETVLPEALLPPGQFAVVVNEKFVADDEIDVAPDPSAILVRVPSLGRSGLSNSGELLRLVHPEGHTISRFPALPKPKAGQSVSRRTPSAPDGVSSSFLISEPTPGLPNAVMADP
ncbi:MAG: lamin tail domain-containing protein [Polyangiaceae bacterium]|nr:lamin tail domain-containing protein [Polyangiaceae bacterium]